MCKEEDRIFITKDDKKFNKCISIPALLVRKNDSADRHFNSIMAYLKLESVATQEDIK